jgi:hypothetical protein
MAWVHVQMPRRPIRPTQQQHKVAATAAACVRRARQADRHRRHSALPDISTIVTAETSQASTLPGCGLLAADASIDSPAAYLRHWRAAVKPRLDALWASVLKTSNAERLLFNLDALLMQLRSSRSVAVHLQQQHDDPAWGEAAAQVWSELQDYQLICIKLNMMQQ